MLYPTELRALPWFQGKYYARGQVNGKFIVKKDNSPKVLFIRRGVGHIVALCEVHARQRATVLGVKPPEAPMKLFRAAQ